MTSLTETSATFLATQLAAGMSIITWVVLWRARSMSVDLWALGGISASIFSTLLAWGNDQGLLPPWVFFGLAATFGAGAALSRLLAIQHLRGTGWSAAVVAMLLGVNFLVAGAFGLAGPSGRLWFSWYLLVVSGASFAGTSGLSWRLGRSLDLLNAKLLAGTTGLAALVLVLALVGAVVQRADILTVNDAPASLPVFALSCFIGLCNSALFIGVVFDLLARRHAEAERAVAELRERARIVADLHDR